MQSPPPINHDTVEPEYKYCCGTTCDREKLARQFIRKDKLIAVQRTLIMEMESYIKKLEGEANAKPSKRKQGPPDTFKSPFGPT